MPLTLILESLHCDTTEDWWSDEAMVIVECDGVVRDALPRSMEEDTTWTLRRVYTFATTCTIRLVDEDWPDPNDALGEVTLGEAGAGLHQEATFTQDDADYTLTYSLLDLGTPAVAALGVDALTLWDLTLTMRLDLYRDLHQVTEGIRGTRLDVSIAEVARRVRDAIAEYAAPSSTFVEAYWTVVFEPVADCLGLVDDLTLALSLANTATSVVDAYLAMVQGVEVMLAVDRVTGPGEEDLSVLIADYCATGERDCHHGGPDPRTRHGSHSGAPTGGLAALLAAEQEDVARLLARAQAGEVLTPPAARAEVGGSLEAVVRHLDRHGMAGTARRWHRSIGGAAGVSEETKAFVLPMLDVLASVLDQERDRCRRLLLSFETGFVGNSATREVHAAGCAFIAMIDAGHLMHFETLAEAFAAGYDGCGHCLPEYCDR